jgi:hypothetical protein
MISRVQEAKLPWEIGTGSWEATSPHPNSGVKQLMRLVWWGKPKEAEAKMAANGRLFYYPVEQRWSTNLC